ncbi:MAG: hypothetical protein QW275_01435 [Candidatus Anstonellaceae archaeon]
MENKDQNKIVSIIEKILTKPFPTPIFLQELKNEYGETPEVFLATAMEDRIETNKKILESLINLARKMDPFEGKFVQQLQDKNATIGDLNAAAIGCALLGQIMHLGKFRNRKDLPKATKNMILDGTMELAFIVAEEHVRKGFVGYFTSFLRKYATYDEFFWGIKVVGEVRGLHLMVNIIEEKFKRCELKLNDKRLAALEDILLEEIAKKEKENRMEKIYELKALVQARTPFISERVRKKAEAVLLAKTYERKDDDIMSLFEVYRIIKNREKRISELQRSGAREYDKKVECKK